MIQNSIGIAGSLHFLMYSGLGQPCRRIDQAAIETSLSKSAFVTATQNRTMLIRQTTNETVLSEELSDETTFSAAVVSSQIENKEVHR